MMETTTNATLVNLKETDAMEDSITLSPSSSQERGLNSLNEIETTSNKILTKEQLATANCCRLCATGSEVDGQENANFFLPLFNKDNTIHQFINKYLPIKV